MATWVQKSATDQLLSNDQSNGLRCCESWNAGEVSVGHKAEYSFIRRNVASALEAHGVMQSMSIQVSKRLSRVDSGQYA
ncbi:hypothetical protein T4B_12864 [Trichinella pseudospiralis]|uniref:Uncharacterized protein n=1 Tax=Trichinella pseudospiralis TaxID=6337 RepID=A0A0V1INS8_TRIPS|nr:hypothetical protein T4A_14479 [Trichinella pseudospiralis]KRZ22966.1 hypothetical protein T4B_12864 [Trichinella pseudospiralis]KRZ24474.1 hypothetical protein T4C_11051 [Trichinella pseudospiralis]